MLVFQLRVVCPNRNGRASPQEGPLGLGAAYSSRKDLSLVTFHLDDAAKHDTQRSRLLNNAITSELFGTAGCIGVWQAAFSDYINLLSMPFEEVNLRIFWGVRLYRLSVTVATYPTPAANSPQSTID